MKLATISLICGALSCLPALAQTGPGGTPANPDQAFVELAAQTDMTEAHLGQVAQQQAASQGVKDFAQMLVTDHTADYPKLSAIASKAGLTVPKGLDAKHNKMIAPFEKLKGAAFDRRYAHEMVAGHEAAIAAYDKESRDGTNADLKAYAKESLPTLEKHKQAGQDLSKRKSAS